MNGHASHYEDQSPQQHIVGGVSIDTWERGLPSATLNYHTTNALDHATHHHQPHPLDTSHSHPYPSQQLSAHSHHLSAETPTAPLLESPSYSQDRESQLSANDSEHDHNTLPPLPSYRLSSINSLSAPPQANPFKRPYQPDLTPGSSPQHSSCPHPQQPVAKRRKSSASKEAWTMTEDDNLLLQLKDEEGLPWKVIALRFHELNRGEFRVPTLQMRYKRLKEKMRVWDADDIQYLKDAKEYVEKQKWELISARMVEMGCKKKIPGSTCEKKWKDIGPHQQPIQSQPMTPLMEQHPHHKETSMTPEMKREISSGGISEIGLNDRDYDQKYDAPYDQQYEQKYKQEYKKEYKQEYKTIDYTKDYIKQDFKTEYDPLQRTDGVQGVAVPV